MKHTVLEWNFIEIETFLNLKDYRYKMEQIRK